MEYENLHQVIIEETLKELEQMSLEKNIRQDKVKSFQITSIYWNSFSLLAMGKLKNNFDDYSFRLNNLVKSRMFEKRWLEPVMSNKETEPLPQVLQKRFL